MGLTRAVSQPNIKAPPKWIPFLESFQASSEAFHYKLLELNKDLGYKFLEKEELLEKRICRKKFYSQKEIEELKEKRDRIEV